MTIPCHKHCPDRSATCHSTCKEYKDFRKWLDEENEAKMISKTALHYRGIKKREMKAKEARRSQR